MPEEKRGQILYVSPHDIVVLSWTFKKDIERQRVRLEKEGQIVPLVCYKDEDGDWTPDLDHYPYANALVHAARDLGFETILITPEDVSD
jgi:hypothetical protein